MNQCAHWRRALHRIRQPDVQRELSRFADRAAENQERNCCRSRTDCRQPIDLERAPTLIEEKCGARSLVEPEQTQKKSDITDARGNEGLLGRGSGARSFDPES